ncbi:MAG: hypothetical protein WC744_02875 [Patescibacteria group bacterium]
MKQQENIKNIIQKSNIVNLLLYSFIFVILIINLIYSQLISPIYYGFTINNEKVTVAFLQKIKPLPEYQRILEMNNNVYGQTIKDEIFSQENQKKEMINNLEQQLTINPRARDVLYSLYQLYLSEGDKNRASDYLRKAREIDPDIN